MLELKKSPSKTSAKVENSPGGKAQVQSKNREIIIQCQYIDAATKKENIRDAIEKPIWATIVRSRELRKALETRKW